MTAVPEAGVLLPMGRRGGATVVLPGQTPEGGHILSVLLKRTYNILPGRVCARAETDCALVTGDVPWGNPLNSTVRFESDFVPYKLATDIVLNGKAYAPDGLAATMVVALEVAGTRKEVRVIGDRVARFGSRVPAFTDPVEFDTMELRYERAYGGIDVYSDKVVSYPYPRNALGQGFVVANTHQGIDSLALPNFEDPADLLTPERLCIHEYANWKNQPMPAGLGWLPKTSLPRAQLVGILPADRALEQQLRSAYAQLVPPDQRDAYVKNALPDMDFRFFNGASAGLAMPFLNGDEQIVTENLGPEGILSFELPGERPLIGLDIGKGIEEPDVFLHTVMIRMEERQIDLVWRGAVTYLGRDWLPQMRTMEVVVV